jgi:hypothetical protein
LLCIFAASNIVVVYVVSETRVSISGNSDVHANSGSKVAFNCKIEGTMGRPAYVFW